MRPFPPLYPILDVAACSARGLDPQGVGAAFLAGGARLVQLRMKTGGSDALLRLADSLVSLARAAGAAIIINDRADIARMAGAAGVHVGQDDLPPGAARALVGDAAIVGLSTHDGPQVDAALAGVASYVAVGPIFDTATKETGYAARGLELVRYASGRGKPVVAIGGMTLGRAGAVWDAGADAVAVIGDLLVTGDPEARVREYLELAGARR